MRALLLESSSTPFRPETLLGALCDLGATPSAVEWELGQLDLAPYHLHFERGEAGGVRFTVHPGAVHTHDQDEADEDSGDHDHDHAFHEHHRHHHDEDDEHVHAHAHADDEGEEMPLVDAAEVIARSDLSPFVRRHAARALGRLGEDFDEDEALEAVVALVGVLAAMEALGVTRVLVAPGLTVPEKGSVGAALLAEFDTVSGGEGAAGLPAGWHAEKTGVGLGRHHGETLRAQLGTLDGVV